MGKNSQSVNQPPKISDHAHMLREEKATAPRDEKGYRIRTIRQRTYLIVLTGVKRARRNTPY